MLSDQLLFVLPFGLGIFEPSNDLGLGRHFSRGNQPAIDDQPGCWYEAIRCDFFEVPDVLHICTNI